MILLDTHAIVWMTHDGSALGNHSRSIANEAREDGQLAVSAISFWEIALLAAKRRLKLHSSPDKLRRELLETDVIEIPLIGDIGILAVGLELAHADPADRFIVATAIIHGATLITADNTLLRWRHPFPRQDASK